MVQDLDNKHSSTQHFATSEALQATTPNDHFNFLEPADIIESLTTSLRAPVHGSSFTGDLQHLANLLELRIREDNDEGFDMWLNEEIEERILMVQSYDSDFIIAEMLKEEAEKSMENVKAARNGLRYTIAEGLNTEVDKIVVGVDGLVEYIEENCDKALWLEARRKLERLGR